MDGDRTIVSYAQVTTLESCIATKKACEHNHVHIGALSLGAVSSTLDVRGHEVLRWKQITTESARSFDSPGKQTSAQRRLLHADHSNTQTIRAAIDDKTVLAIVAHRDLDASGLERCFRKVQGQRVKVALIYGTGAGECRVWRRFGQSVFEGDLGQRDWNVQSNVVNVKRAPVVVPRPSIVRPGFRTRWCEHDAETANRAIGVVNDEIAGTGFIHAVPARNALAVVTGKRSPDRAVAVPKFRRSSLIDPPRVHHVRSLSARYDVRLSKER